MVISEAPRYDVSSVKGTDVAPGADKISTELAQHPANRRRSLVAGLLVVCVAAGAGVVIYRERHSFVDTLQRMGAWPMLASFACGLIGISATYPVWRQVLQGLDVNLPWGAGARVFFISQLGKYLPGSVWPVLMQMEAGRARGASRRTMLAANLITVVMSCCVGLLVACLLLPLYDAQALGRYWWALIALPLLVGLLHPRVLPALLDKMFALLHRAPLGEQLDIRSGVRACGWSLVSWTGLGANLVVLCAALGHHAFSTIVLCIGGMALAFSLGVLFIPAPAGAGIRDVVLTVVLTTILSAGQALAVVVASRAILIGCDVVLAGLVTVVGRHPSAGDSASARTHG